MIHRSKLKPEELDFVELLGGGTRVPRLQAVLQEALGGRALDRHLDADEAVSAV
jgi:hypoxia up-regulated 1